jgi:hypothetical protein
MCRWAVHLLNVWGLPGPLPSEWGQAPSLERLLLDNNEINGAKVVVMPSVLFAEIPVMIADCLMHTSVKMHSTALIRVLASRMGSFQNPMVPTVTKQ